MKNTLTATTLAIVLTLGATFANAGIIVSDKGEGTCKNGIIVSDAPGIIVSDGPTGGIIVSDIASAIAKAIAGIIVSDVKGNPCKDGIIVSDAPTAGIIVSD